LLSVAVLLAVTVAIKLGIAANSHRDFRTVASKFSGIRRGDTREAVIRMLGQPNNHDGECVAEFGPSKDCAREMVYSDPYDVIFGDFYIVDFSAEGQVIAAYHFK
jgi:hypothetical protein